MGSGSSLDWLATVRGSSEMGRAVLDHDWAATPLGPADTWPEGLRAAVGMCLATQFPAMIVWGPELTMIYNDGFRPVLGSEKHPDALGAPARRVWAEIWDSVSPLFDSVLATAQPTWEEDFRVVLHRNGYPEESYFTFSYSPLYDDAGEVAGVLDLVVETTARVTTSRRLACLSALNAALADAEQVTDACLATAAALSDFPDDVRFADVFLRTGDQLVLLASTRRGDIRPAAVDRVAGGVAAEPIIVGGDDSGLRPADHVAVPIGTAFTGNGEGPLRGVLVVGLNPERPYDHAYRSFVEAIADAVTNALDGAYHRTVELGEYRRVSDTLQQAMLPPAQDLPTIAARYLPTVGSLAVGGDWYDVIDLDDHRRALIVGDCVGHGLAAATVMGQLRSATRAMLLDGRSPAEMLAGLDTFAAHEAGANCATVVCVVFDRWAREITCAGAGHPPALIVGPRGHRWLESGGPPLAVAPDVKRQDTTLAVADDEVLVLYSDGLIERRGESIDVGMERLAGAVAARQELPAQLIADGLLHDLLPRGTADDDVVLVVKHLLSAPVP